MFGGQLKPNRQGCFGMKMLFWNENPSVAGSIPALSTCGASLSHRSHCIKSGRRLNDTARFIF